LIFRFQWFLQLFDGRLKGWIISLRCYHHSTFSFRTKRLELTAPNTVFPQITSPYNISSIKESQWLQPSNLRYLYKFCKRQLIQLSCQLFKALLILAILRATLHLKLQYKWLFVELLVLLDVICAACIIYCKFRYYLHAKNYSTLSIDLTRHCIAISAVIWDAWILYGDLKTWYICFISDFPLSCNWSLFLNSQFHSIINLNASNVVFIDTRRKHIRKVVNARFSLAFDVQI